MGVVYVRNARLPRLQALLADRASVTDYSVPVALHHHHGGYWHRILDRLPPSLSNRGCVYRDGGDFFDFQYRVDAADNVADTEGVFLANRCGPLARSRYGGMRYGMFRTIE